MRKVLSGLLLVVVTTVFMSGCAQNQQSSNAGLTPAQIEKKQFVEIYGNGKIKAPAWVNKPSIGAEKYPLVVAGKSDYIAGRKRLKRMHIAAMNDARRALANVLERVIEINNYEKNKDDLIDNADKYREAIDRNVEEHVHMPLSGAYAINSVVTADGALWKQVVLDPGFLQKFLKKYKMSEGKFRDALSKVKKYDEFHNNMINEVKKEFNK